MSLAPFMEEVALLTTIPGVSRVASWAGACPGNRQSAGKWSSGKPTKGNVWLRAVLGEVACAAARTRDTYLRAQFEQLAKRRGRKQAVVAVGHSIPVIAYHLLRTRQPYTDLGPDDFDSQDTERLARQHIQRLGQLGYEVTVTRRRPRRGFS